MRIEPFRLERFFAKHEFTAPYQLSASDCEPLSLRELLAYAPPESLALWENLRLAYTETQGHPLLRREISEMYESVPPEAVLVAVPEEAIFVLMHTLLEAGDHAVILAPAYQSLYEVAQSAGCEVTRVNLHAGADGWHLDLNELKRALNQRTRLLIANFPHNPTGYLPSRCEFDSVIDMAREGGLYILGDEMYRYLEHEPANRLPAICDAYERGISLGGLSKSFGLPGLRTGWLATRERPLIERWLRLKDYTTICHSAPGEVLGIIALRARDEIIERNRRIVRINLDAARTFALERGDLFQWIEPGGGSIVFPRWRGPGTVDDFCQVALEQRGVCIVPGSLFDFPGDHFRIGLGRLDMREVLARIEKCRPPLLPPCDGRAPLST